MPTLSTTRTLCLGLLLMSAAGCTVNQTEVSSLTGPSEYALSVGVTASPDTLTQDGLSSTVITVSAFGPDGAPMPNVTFRLDTFVNNSAIVGYGTLLNTTLVTGGNGKATTTYTAPKAVAGDTSTCNGLPGGCVTITATPVGTNFANNSTRAVEIHLVSNGVIQPSNGVTPVAAFNYSPSAIVALAQVNFDASGSTAGTGHQIVGYRWDWGDGDPVKTYTVPTEQHDFVAAGNYRVTLTVVDEIGQETSLSRFVKVNAAS